MRVTHPMIAAFNLTLLAALTGCGQATGAGPSLPAPKVDDTPATQPGEADQGDQGGQMRTAVLAGGCFWCVEAIFERVEGVKEVVSGFAGGQANTAQYKMVAAGKTDHAESVKITYDPGVITYGQILQIFFATHHPTQVNRQGPDYGEQYRSAIFYDGPRQKEIARQYINQLEQAGVYDEPIATTLEQLKGFYPAEDYHQDYVENNPNDMYIRQYFPPKLKKLKSRFPEQVETE